VASDDASMHDDSVGLLKFLTSDFSAGPVFYHRVIVLWPIECIQTEKLVACGLSLILRGPLLPRGPLDWGLEKHTPTVSERRFQGGYNLSVVDRDLARKSR
jgi:hypothetical protein